MKKILTVFLRDLEHPGLVTREPHPDCRWVFEGLGTPTLKRDGANIRIDVFDGKILAVQKRRNPSRVEKAQGVEPGYVLANPADPADQHIYAAVKRSSEVRHDPTGQPIISEWQDGEWSCEALGPKIQGGFEGKTPWVYNFTLYPEELPDIPRNFDDIRQFLAGQAIEGIVWHFHPNGVVGEPPVFLAKVKSRDFSIPWPPQK